MDARATTIRCIAFSTDRRVALGSVLEVALAVREHFEHQPTDNILIFDAATSRPVELYLDGSKEQVAARYAVAEQRAKAAASPESAPENVKPRRGRPKLGVVGREVTLLPRHWEWLGKQPGGASVTLRKLIDRERRTNAGAEKQREAQESTYRFMQAMAGDRPGYEEALRALYAGREEDFNVQTGQWPADVRDHARGIAQPVFEAPES